MNEYVDAAVPFLADAQVILVGPSRNMILSSRSAKTVGTFYFWLIANVNIGLKNLQIFPIKYALHLLHEFLIRYCQKPNI